MIEVLEIAKIRRDAQPMAVLDETVVAEWAEAIRLNSWAPLSARSLFADITHIDDQHMAERIQRHCLKQGVIPLIQQDPNTGGYVFHTLYPADGTVSRKAIAKQFEHQAIKSISTHERRVERSVEAQLADDLRQAGHIVKRQQHCAAGRADIVTEEAIYEIKHRLTRNQMFEAVGQVLTYRQAIDPNLRPVIVGRPDRETRDLIAPVAALGVEVILWEK
jgi:hypothetical protein